MPQQSQSIVVPSLILPRTFERFDTAAFLESATRYFNDRWKLHEFDPSGIKLPPHRPGFGWGVLMPPASANVTAQRIFDKLGERFLVWRRYPDKSLNETLDPTKEARQPGNTGHIIWCQAVAEADERHRNKSANDIVQLRIATMGLAERLLLEDFVLYLEWAEHLDVVNATLCAGSRHSDGRVPHVYWDSSRGRLDVYGCSPDDADGFLRSREVVSADAQAAA